MNSILEITGLYKNFFGKAALSDISLSLDEGRIVGLLGPNGSGKTTLLKLIAGFLQPTKGQIRISGQAPSYQTKAFVAFLPDTDFLYEEKKIADISAFYKDFFSDFDLHKFNELCAFMNLERGALIKSLSKGMKEKLQLSIILSRSAKLYMLDEPLGGVDPITRDKIINAIIRNYMENSSMIISTHLVDYIEPLLDEVVFLRNGQIALHGMAEELRAEKNMSVDKIYREVYIND